MFTSTLKAPAATLSLAAALNRLAQRRDPEAWEALLLQCGPDILRVTRRALGDAALAEDACQETLLQIRAHAGSFKAPASPESAQFAARIWIMRIASNIAISMARSRARSKRRDDVRAAAAPRVDTDSPAERKLRDEESEWLRQELAALPEILREPVLLRFFGELDYAELGSALACSPDAAKKRVQRGLDQLRSRLALLGVSLTLAEMSAHLLGGGSAQAAEAVALATGATAASATLNASQQLAWKALLNASAAPALSGVVPLGGITLMVKATLAFIALVSVMTFTAVVAIPVVHFMTAPSAPPTVNAPAKSNGGGAGPRSDPKDDVVPPSTGGPAPTATPPVVEVPKAPAVLPAVEAPKTPPATPPAVTPPAVEPPAQVKFIPPAPPKKDIPLAPDKTSGRIKGRVKFNGTPPPPKAIKVPDDKAPDCHHNHIVSEELVVDPKTLGIKWAMVRVMGVKNPPPVAGFAEPTIDQKGCMFQPHVVIVPPGINLHVLNSEHVAHNFHTTPLDATNPGYNRMITAGDEKGILKGEKYFAEPEVIKIQCDVHPWMNGFIVCHDPRYAAITAADGSFEIPSLPPGKYDVSVFHELGEQTFKIEVKADQTVDMGEVLFPAKKNEP